MRDCIELHKLMAQRLAQRVMSGPALSDFHALFVALSSEPFVLTLKIDHFHIVALSKGAK